MKIGIDIGGSHIAVGLVDNKGNIILKKEKNTSSDNKKNIEKFIEETIAISINNILQEKSIGKYGVLQHEEYKILKRLCEVVGTERYVKK